MFYVVYALFLMFFMICQRGQLQNKKYSMSKNMMFAHRLSGILGKLSLLQSIYMINGSEKDCRPHHIKLISAGFITIG